MCLSSIKNQTHTNIEIVIVDGFSTDNTRNIIGEFCSRTIINRALRSEARNIGALTAVGEYLLFIDSDMELTSQVVEKGVLKLLNDYDALIIPEISVGEGFWAKCKALEKMCYLGDDLIEASRFFNKKSFETVAGYDTNLVAGEDWDLDQRIREAGYRVGRIGAIIKHHEGKLTLRKIFLKKHYYGKTLENYRRKQPIVSKKQLNVSRRSYLKNWKLLAKYPLHSIGMLFVKSLEFISIFLGSIN